MTKEEDFKNKLQLAQDDLMDLETYIREFSMFLPLAVVVINPIGIITDVNRAFRDLTNYDSIKIVGENISKIFLETDKIRSLLNDTQKERVLKNGELTLISKENKEIPVNVFISIREDEEGKFIGYFLAISDIREIKKLQESLEVKVNERTKELEKSRIALMNILEDVEEERKKAEEEKDKTLTIIQNFADGLLVFDKENKLSLINPWAERFFGLKKENVTGQSVSKLNDFPTIRPVIKLIGEKIKRVFRENVKIGKDLVLEVSTIPIKRNAEETGTMIILHDVTREKRIEKMKTEFVSIAAHQLRTPLSGVKWTLRMLLDEDFGKITQEQREFIEKTYRSNERMIILVNDLLNVTRIEEGRYLYKPVLADIEPICQSVINSHKMEIKRKKIKIEFNKSKKKLPKVKIDVEKITLAIQNLLENAIRYTPLGGKIIISLSSKEKEIEFSMKDTGIGIPKDQQSRIFTKFFRSANAVRMETEGSGLGLFITKNIIEAHGGRIWFESKEGKGTVFFFVLPVK